MKHRLLVGVLLVSVFIASSIPGGSLFAQVGEINDLKDEISAKQSSIDQINRKIDQYRKQITAKQKEVSSLDGELELLSNRIAKAELDIKATEEKIGAANAEIALLDKELEAYEEELERERSFLIEILQQIDKQDNDFDLRVFFGSESFSEIFDHLQYLEDVNSDLKDSLDKVKNAKDIVLASRVDQEGKKEKLTSLHDSLSKERYQLDHEVGAKETLINETQHSEAQFRALLNELKQEQSYINHQIGKLQNEIEQKLVDADEGGDATILSWPAKANRGISAYFHDPTYPFRHLFEHSGIDVPLNQGTPLKAAAPGYVAWARTGRMYGNYVMIIHANGVATLYAHMSRMDVKPDQFVARGQQIGLSGGRAGSPGAGLSTGPHLHFEVRKDGIPTNPLDYLTN